MTESSPRREADHLTRDENMVAQVDVSLPPREFLGAERSVGQHHL
jgi:hypothetical protein